MSIIKDLQPSASIEDTDISVLGKASEAINRQFSFAQIKTWVLAFISPLLDDKVSTVVGGTNTTVDSTDPKNPIVNVDGKFNPNEVNGFNRLLPDLMGVASFDNASRTFSIGVVSGQADYRYWVAGVEHIETTTKSVIIPDTTGTYYFYFDASGVMQYVLESAIFADVFYKFAICGGVYWNSESQVGNAWEERHGNDMSSTTHAYNHLTFGSRYGSGYNPSGFVVGNTTYTGIGDGDFWDEDIHHVTTSSTSNKFLYRLGANGAWRFSDASLENGLKENAGDSYYSWNEWTGTEWKLTQGGSSTDYYIMFFVATPSLGTNQVVKIVSQNAYSSRLGARGAIESEMTKLRIDALPTHEINFLYATIIKRDGKLQAVDGDSSTFLDLRTVGGSSPSVASPSLTPEQVSSGTTEFSAVTSRDLLLTDKDNFTVRMTSPSASAVFNLLPNVTVALPMGSKWSVIKQTSQTVSVTAPTGVTLNGVDGGSCDIITEWEGVSIEKINTNDFAINGNHTVVA